MIDSFQSLQNRYWDWVRGQRLIQDLGGIYEITTPYLDRFNDCVQIYARMLEADKILITDGGGTLEDLALLGHSLSSDKWTDVIREILNGFNVSMDAKDRSLYAECSIEDFPVTAHNVIQTVLAIIDLGYMSTSLKVTRQAPFRNRVKREFAFFENWEIADNPRFTGRSGVPRKFNFMVNNTTVIQCFASITKQGSDAFVCSWLDADQESEHIRCSALIQDVQGQSIDTPCAIMKYYDIKPVVASSGIRNGLLEIMESAEISDQ
ncbi:MAG: DUF1828 domain-containing protein [Rhodothermaceae bacterium]|nr:DUF1828 domain-containing protein [Rhodothermaceae bacterium]MYG70520.1 DUF1828 domain-containing protein [Rhodothermaceae bacterium]